MTYTEKELDQFLHGISLSLLSKKSAQHWRYDEETAKEIEWLEVLERKVRADKADRKTEPSGYKMEQVDEPQTDTEIAKAIVHKMINDAVIAEDAYPDLRQKMHDAVDEYEPQRGCDADCNEDCTECARESELWRAEQTDCSWK